MQMTTSALPRRVVSVLVTTALVGGGLLLSAGPASAKVPAKYKNCAAVNRTYPHGVGKAKAHDKVSGRARPVTSFTRSTKAYTAAMKANKGLDRDKDGIACEKH